MAVGTIFSILPYQRQGQISANSDFLQAGNQQLAAGYLLYGTSTVLALTIADNVVMFSLDPDSNDYVLIEENVQIDADTSEYAINASNYRYWQAPMQQYIDELQEELRDYRLAERGTESGRIIGKEYLARQSELASSQPTSPTSASYIANMSTGKFHRSTCSYLPDVGNRAYFYSAEAARAAGYSPCGHCNP